VAAQKAGYMSVPSMTGMGTGYPMAVAGTSPWGMSGYAIPGGGIATGAVSHAAMGNSSGGMVMPPQGMYASAIPQGMPGYVMVPQGSMGRVDGSITPEGIALAMPSIAQASTPGSFSMSPMGMALEHAYPYTIPVSCTSTAMAQTQATQMVSTGSGIAYMVPASSIGYAAPSTMLTMPAGTSADLSASASASAMPASSDTSTQAHGKGV